ncbi:50S ribosomal protein L29 [soil metagenome]|jgi:large subunit ribosomal protein L29|nr:50S ribosomal protein L29 [Actinomycetota bacterium]MDQ3218565.1 50S ribosomal protein L29 [Actinomycetota bacterium]
MASAAELRELSIEEIEQALAETGEELFNLRFQHATGQLENYRRLRQLRREIARIKTVLRERELGEAGVEHSNAEH